MFPTTSKKSYLAAQLNVPFESLSESELRLETVLGTTNSYKFNVQENQGDPLVSEIRLKLNDLFIVTHVGLLLKKIASGTPTDAQQVAAKLFNYPNPSVFVAANEAANLEAIYNGNMSFSIDRQVNIPSLMTRNFFRIPEAQQGAIQAAIAGPVTYTTPRDGFPNSLYGYYPTDVFQFDGAQTLNFQLNLNAAIDLTAAGQTNYVVLLLKGYLAQDQAKKARALQIK